MMNESSPKKFLLIEDDDDHAELVKVSMEMNGSLSELYRVSNGVEGIAYLKQEGEYAQADRPDIILLDLNMPILSGHEVIRHVKESPSLKTIPIVVLTTSNAEVDRAKAYESSANGYVVKPVDFAQFREMMRDFDQFWSVWNKPAPNESVA